MDRAADRVVVTADSTVSAAEVAAIKQRAGADAGAIRINRTPGTFRPLLSAGDAIYGGQYRCSLGFNVVSGSTYYFLTAGHCGKVANDLVHQPGAHHADRPDRQLQLPGQRLRAGPLRQHLAVPPGWVHRRGCLRRRVGQAHRLDHRHPQRHRHRAERLGPLQRRHGTVSGMIQTTVCAEPGDSGGPLYDGTKALGITSGGSGDCTSGGTTFFQPVREAANAYGVTVF